MFFCQLTTSKRWRALCSTKDDRVFEMTLMTLRMTGTLYFVRYDGVLLYDEVLLCELPHLRSKQSVSNLKAMIVKLKTVKNVIFEVEASSSDTTAQLKSKVTVLEPTKLSYLQRHIENHKCLLHLPLFHKVLILHFFFFSFIFCRLKRRKVMVILLRV